MNTMEAMMTLKSLRNAIYAMGGLSICRDNQSIVGEQYEAIDEAIKAVKKTIPQKAKHDIFGIECPNCGRYVTYPSSYTVNGKKVGIRCDYCYSCGQALDWSEE